VQVVQAAAERPKVGLVLSGGGARGAAHIGVLKVLEEQRIPIDYVAGTSMGAIVGGLYASGMTADEIEADMLGVDWLDALDNLIPRADRPFRRKRDDDLYLVRQQAGFNDGEFQFSSGLINGQKIELLLRSFVEVESGITSFDELPTPFRAVATDIATGEPYVLDSGDLAVAMRASMSIPAVFGPVVLDDHMLVDGGVANNLPINIVRKMGADIVIAVDVSTPLQTSDELDSLLAVTQQLTGILTRRNTEGQLATLKADDVLIIPPLGDISNMQFDRSAEGINEGFVAATEKLPVLARLGLSDSDYQDYLVARRDARSTGTPMIEFVRLDNNSRVSDAVIMARIDVETGQPLDLPALQDDIAELYGLELFERVQYELVKEEGKTGLQLKVEERPWGPNYLQLGVNLASDLNGDNSLNLGLAYTQTAINSLGGEWRTGVAFGEEPGIQIELYQPLDVASRFFIEPVIKYQKRNVNRFFNGEKLAEFRVTEAELELSGGMNLGNWGELRTGWRRGFGDARVEIGLPEPDFNFDTGEAFVRLFGDTLDNRRFPHSGYSASLEWLVSRDSLGADMDFEQVLFDGIYAQPFGRGTLLFGANYETTLDDDAPVQSLFRSGGFQRLSGFIEDELVGQHSAVLSLGYMRPLAEGDLVFIPGYAGMSLELGNVWDRSSDISFSDSLFAGSLFIGADTFVGPVYLAYGRAEGGNGAIYLFVGQVF